MDSTLLRSLGALSLLLVACACSAIRFEEEPTPEPPPAPGVTVAGDWAGVWEIEGQRIQGMLVLRQEGNDLRATFASPALGGDAVGSGSLEDRRVRLELEYNVACPGTAQLSGDVLAEGAQLDGALVATDCTGRATGTFSFARR